MRILVLSDAHRINYKAVRAIESEPTAEVVYYLGDGANDIVSIAENYRDKFFIILKGNCDFSAPLPETDIRTLENTKIYACHGHNENVKYGYYHLFCEARQNNCQLALFGHTHEPYHDYENEIHLFNPGSIRDGNYGVIDITPKGIMCIHKKLND